MSRECEGVSLPLLGRVSGAQCDPMSPDCRKALLSQVQSGVRLIRESLTRNGEFGFETGWLMDGAVSIGSHRAVMLFC